MKKRAPRFWARMSLGRKVVILAFSGSAVVVAAFSLLSMWAVEQSTQRSLQERLVLATAAAESLDQYNDSVLRQLGRTALLLQQPAAEGWRSHMDSVLQQSQATSSSTFNHLLVTGRQGELLGLYPPGSSISPGDLQGYAGATSVVDSGVAYISGVVPSPVDGVPVVVYSVPLKGDNGTTIGVLSGGVELASSGIGGFIEAIRLGRTGYAQVVDAKGELIASTEPQVVFGKSDHGDRFVSLIEDRKSVVRTCHSCHEAGQGQAERRKDVMAFAPLSTASWGVAVRQSEEEALVHSRRLRQGMLIVGLVSLGLVLPAAAAVAGRVVRPVLRLSDASRRMAGGDLDTRIGPAGEDEVGTLANNLEAMRKALKESRREVEARRHEAEALYDISVEISGMLDTDGILSSVVEKARQLLSAHVSILMLVGEGGKLYARAASGAQGQSVYRVSLAPGQGFGGAVTALGRPLSTEDYLADPTFVHDRIADSVVVEEGLGSHLGVPLKLGGEVLGALLVAQRERREFTGQEGRLLARLANQVVVVIRNAHLYEEVRRKEQLRGQLLRRAIAAQEEERKRIARELHDEPAQIFSALVMQLEAMARDLPASERSVKERLQKLQGLADHALGTVRKMMADLRPTALDDLGLVPAVRQYAESRLGEVGVNVDFEVTNMDTRLPGQIETVVFRVLQEAVTNVYKHACARNVNITLARENGRVRATVRDDGVGFDVGDISRGKGAGQRLGLLGIEERVTLLGGKLTILSAPGTGTKLSIDIPIPDGGADGKRNEEQQDTGAGGG